MKLIGIDSGGTSCRLLLCDGEGTALSACKVKGHNPNMDGFDAVEESFRTGLDLLLREHGGREAAVDALHGGISGGEGGNKEKLIAILRGLLPHCPSVTVSNDALIGLAAGLGRRDGGVLIAGTGTIGFVRMGKTLCRFGGWGYLVDEGGSGWHIGRDGLRAAMAGLDEGLPATALTALYEARLGQSMSAAIPALYRGEVRLPEYAPLVFQAAEGGDQAAQAVLEHNARCLKKTLDAMSARFGAPLPVVLVGGLLERGSIYLRTLETLCKDAPITFVHAHRPPQYGAVVLAAQEAGLPEDPGFAAHFDRTYPKLEEQL